MYVYINMFLLLCIHISMCMLPGVLSLCAYFRVCCLHCNGCVEYDALRGLCALEWVQSVQCSGYTECITLGVVGTML
jgi:hypothetical protein